MLKFLLTLGLFGEFSTALKLYQTSKLFYPFYLIHVRSHCAYVPFSCTIGKNLNMPHGINGCFFSCDAVIGDNCTIMHHVTLGSTIYGGSKRPGAPHIGNNVFIGAGAKLIGGIHIGDNAKIGAGCVVVDDVPANAVCVMPKPRMIIK